MTQKKPRVCGRLVQNQLYGRVDVCGEEAGHDESLEPTPHKGQYRGMIWENFLTPLGKKGTNIIHQGEAFEGERLQGGQPITEIKRHGPGGHVPPPPFNRKRPTP